MLRITEFFDMDRVEAVRLAALGRGLDAHDNFSWHIALTDGGKLLGVARLFREDEALRLDSVALAPEAGENAGNYREMLFRTLMLKATVEKPRLTRATPEVSEEFYTKFGFQRRADVFEAETEKLVFPKKCKECGTC